MSDGSKQLKEVD